MLLVYGDRVFFLKPYKEDEFHIYNVMRIDCFYIFPKHPDLLKANITNEIINKQDVSIHRSDFKMKAFLDELKELVNFIY